MPYILWILITAPVIASGTALHNKMKEQSDKRWVILPKCLATWMMVCTALLGTFQFGTGKSSGWILAAMVLFLIADGLLELRFFPGMAMFAAGHLALIIWFILQRHFTVISVPVWITGMAVVLWLFRKELSGAKEEPKLYLMILYAAVLIGMTAIAVTLPFTAGKTYGWAAAGAVMFSMSDMMVGKNFFKRLPKKLDHWGLRLYYAGIFCLSMMTWM